MAWQDFKLIGFAPDLPVTTPGTLLTSTFCMPTDRGIGNFPSIADTSTAALSTVSMGGALVSTTAAAGELIVGTATKLYSFDLGTTLTDRSAGAYGATTTYTWSVTAFGNIVLAANRVDILQQRTIGAAANFAAVGAAPVPKASIVITAGPTSAPFAVVFDFDDGTANDRDGWKCSAIADYTNWTAATATQCANGRLIDNVPGPITAAIPYRDGIVAWKRSGMYLGRYDGPPNIWSWQRISSDVGCLGKNACVEANDVIYFADDCGLWMFDGSYPRPVQGYVQKYWTDSVAGISDIDRNFTKVIWDKLKHVIWFAISGVSGATCPTALIYNTVSGLWTCTTPVAEGNVALFDNGTVYSVELISARYFISNAKKVATASYPATGSGINPPASYVAGWLFGDRVTTPIIKGIRPHWAKGGSSGLTGGVGSLNTEGAYQPGSYYGTATNFAYRAPGKLDGLYSAPIVIPSFSVAAANVWEITGISIDIGTAGKS